MHGAIPLLPNMPSWHGVQLSTGTAVPFLSLWWEEVCSSFCGSAYNDYHTFDVGCITYYLWPEVWKLQVSLSMVFIA
jgi:hypothetical protein